MITGIEAVIVPVASELLKNLTVSAVKFFRDRTEKDEEAKGEAKQRLSITTINVQSAVEEIIGSALTPETKTGFEQLVNDSVSQLPIAEGLALVSIARYCEMPVYRVQQTEVWMSDPSYIRTATNHAWIENQFEQCLMRLGYGIEKGHQLTDGVVNSWVDLLCRTAREPSHRICVDIICNPDPIDYEVTASLYDMQTAGVLQKGDWFFIATHGIFNWYVNGIIDRAKAYADYAIGTTQAQDIKSMIEAQEDPKKLWELLRNQVGG
ncbi:hypothetical protein ACFLVN_01530 [Chloroflexota bacterium]